MGYLEQSIGPRERLLFEAKVHWIVYAAPVFWMIVGVVLAPVTYYISLILTIGGLIALIGALIYSSTTDLAVTDKKIIAKWGLISRRTIEQRLGKVDTVQVDQGILGRILDYGNITVTGSGFAPTPIKLIAKPLTFRRAVEAAEDEEQEGDTRAKP